LDWIYGADALGGGKRGGGVPSSATHLPRNQKVRPTAGYVRGRTAPLAIDFYYY